MKRRAPPPLDEREFPREGTPGLAGGRRVLDDDGSVAPICGGSSAERARARRNPRRVEIRGNGCDRRRGGRSQGGGGGGEHGGLGNFSEDLRDSGRVRGSA